MIHSMRVYLATEREQGGDNRADMTFDEIDEVMGWPPGSAWQANKSAMKKLRKQPGRVKALQQLAQMKSARIF